MKPIIIMLTVCIVIGCGPKEERTPHGSRWASQEHASGQDISTELEILSNKVETNQQEMMKNLDKLAATQELSDLMSQWLVLEANAKDLVRCYEAAEASVKTVATADQVRQAGENIKSLTAEMEAAAATMKKNAERRRVLKNVLGMD